MKQILLASTVIFSATSAFAADAIVYNEPAPVLVADAFSWTGGYVGVNAGYVWGKGRADNVYQPQLWDDGERFNSRFNLKGAIGGIQAGYNYQLNNNIVLGAEGDFQWLDFDGSYNTQLGDSVTAKLKWLSTIRARLGYAIDKTMLYTTGGIAIGKLNIIAHESSYNADFSGSKTHVGWTIGTGVEHALTDHFTVKLEYNYVNLGSKTYTLIDNGETNYLDASAKGSGYGSIIRAGINYKF